MKRNISKSCSAFACLIFLLSIALSANADTVTWIGGGADNLASNPANWTGGVAPRESDDVLFDRLSSKDCTWDIADMTLSALKITSAYTGKVTKLQTATLIIETEVVWTGGGADNLASNPANWSGNEIPQNGSIIVFNNTSAEDCTWDINITPSIVTIDASYDGNITLNQPLNIARNLLIYGGVLDLSNQNLNIDGYIIIGAGATLIARSSVITLFGDWWQQAGALFDPGASTLILDGISQHIYGNNTFYNLQKTATSPDTLYFQAGYTQTIENNLTLSGAANNLLTLTSTTAGQQWKINPQGTSNLSYVYIADSYNISFTSVSAINSVDGGNNTGISFGGNECVQ